MTSDATNHFYKVVVPRSCIKDPPNKVRLYAEGRNFAGSASPSYAGPTKLIARG